MNHDVRVDRAEVLVVAADPASAISVIRTARDNLSAILARAARAVGEDVLVLRRVQMRFMVHDDGAGGLSDAVTGALRRSLESRFASALNRARDRSADYRGLIGEDVAWFPSEAAWVAAHLASLVDPSVPRWPFAGATVRLDATWDEILETTLSRGHVFTGDVLSALGLWVKPSRVADSVRTELADRLVAVFTSVVPSGPIPEEVVRHAWSKVWFGVSPQASQDWTHTLPEPIARLLVLMALLQEWPPLRETGIEPRQLGLSAKDGEHEMAHGAAQELLSDNALPSRCGGLVFWAWLFGQLQLDAALSAAWGNARTLRAVRWAIGRALEDPSSDPRDPLLMLWAGESPGARLSSRQVLERADPEPLKRLGLGFARDRRLLTGRLRVAPLGDGFVTLQGRTLVDWHIATNTAPTPQEILAAYAARTGNRAPGVDFMERTSDADLDVVRLGDVPALPDSWRPAVACFVSALSELVRIDLGLTIRRWRRWAALVNADSITLRSGDVRSVKQGTWLAGGRTAFGAQAYRVSVA